ncbi:MAG: hypothetical protein R3273_10140 [Pseudidiomarina maritima]|uniref:MSHA biogenesis protein MshI n=1 Tax=Pseudidiomarina sp. PP-1MA TaxID=3237706 RepID=A0AB39X786_9GAMM|nr:hypothetical protein [Pseudidiomarina maritima]
MKRIANLYVAELQPNRDPLTLKLVSLVVGTLLVVVMIGAGLSKWYLANQQATTAKLSAQNTAVQQQVNQQQELLKQALNDKQLLAEIDQLELRLAQRQRLLQHMRSVTQTGQPSFANVMTDLARVDNDNIWLQRIVLAYQDMTLQGHTTAASALPRWLASFSNYPTLKNRNFGVFELRDEQNGALQFTVGSDSHGSLLLQQPSQLGTSSGSNSSGATNNGSGARP